MAKTVASELPQNQEVYYTVWGDDGHLHAVEATPELDKKFEEKIGQLKDTPFNPDCYAWVSNRHK